VSYSTIRRAEAATGVPPLHAENLVRIARALMDAGIELIDSDGVRLRPRR
jgi:hypothetical protein